MRIAITGGSGFIGRGVVAELVARGDDVTVLTRNPSAARRNVDARAKLAEWDPARAELWADVIRESEAVIHLAGEGVFDKRWTAKRKLALRESRVDSTARIARVMAGATNGPKVFVSASAVGIYGMRSDDSLSDESDRKGTDFLAELAKDWEAAAEPARAGGIRVTHPRIGIVLGPEGGALGKMLSPFKLYVGGPLGDGRQWFSWIHRNDAVRAIIHGLDRSDLVGAYNVTAPNPVTMNVFAHALGHTLGRPSMARVPPIALKLALGGERADVLLTGQRAIPKRLLETGFTFEFPSLPAALEDLLVQNAA